MNPRGFPRLAGWTPEVYRWLGLSRRTMCSHCRLPFPSSLESLSGESRQARETIRRLQPTRRHVTPSHSCRHCEHSSRATLLHFRQRLRRLETPHIPNSIHSRVLDGFEPTIRRVPREEQKGKPTAGGHPESRDNPMS